MKAKTLIRSIGMILVLGVSVSTLSAQGNARKDKDKHNKTHYVAPPSSDHRNKHVAPPSKVPHGAHAIRHNNRDYYWHNGACYYNNAIVVPPYGLIIPSLPRDYTEVKYKGNNYYYYRGNYYSKYRNGYKVIEPIRGLIINMLPQGYVKIKHRGDTYYKSNGIYYRVIDDRRNRTSYEVVGRRLP